MGPRGISARRPPGAVASHEQNPARARGWGPVSAAIDKVGRYGHRPPPGRWRFGGWRFGGWRLGGWRLRDCICRDLRTESEMLIYYSITLYCGGGYQMSRQMGSKGRRSLGSSSHPSKITPLTRDEILAIYERGPDEVIALVEGLYAIIINLGESTAVLGEHIGSLERRLDKISPNSHKPPSTDRVNISGSRHEECDRPVVELDRS